jgi:UV DNA damage endonuclease
VGCPAAPYRELGYQGEVKLRHLGYACQNLSLNLSTGRTLRLANLSEEKGYGVIDANLSALTTILEWNLSRNILFFRISSEVVPFGGHEAFPSPGKTSLPTG